MADKAGGNPDVWKSAVMVCRPLAFLVWCGRPKGGLSCLGGGGQRRLGGPPGFSASRQYEPLGAPGDSLSPPAAPLVHVYKHPIPTDYKPLVQLG